MRFSSIAIIFQSASIFLTVLAVSTIDHIPEESKKFNCHQSYISKKDFARTPRTEIKRVAENKLSWSWTDQLSYMMKDSRNQNSVLFGNESQVSKFYILDNLTTDHTSGDYDYTYEYIILVDKKDRACGVIMRVLTRVKNESSILPDQNISFCSIEA
ncbi:BgTH12-05170 [Blumeria graminis f. sp. triticale]|uniref:BgtE-5953 n=2 Tax=Blumeria graminis TaxID=34373 RepID=A0A9X9MHA5_BLUGR|nr:BgTH12-05170 [Blumeria graminis f. sp. triticale]VDB87995.1 BgtE-5953 [Blumeria graminis f. sp. tritici]